VKAGWKLQRLGDLCAFDKSQGIHTNLPYVGLEHIESDTGQYLGNLEPTDVKSSTFKFNDSHVLYGRLRPYLNKVLLPDFEGHCSTEIFPIQIKPGLLREYLGHWLMSESVVESINTTCTGARMPRADMNAVLEFNIPVPSEQEQRRIVTLLDEAFADIATAKANAEKNLQNARELFEEQLTSIFGTSHEDWIDATIDQHIRFIDYRGKTPVKTSEGLRLITAKNVKMGFLQTQPEEFVASETYDSWMTRGIPKQGDVLFTTEAPLANVAQLDTDEKVVFAQRIIIMQSDQQKLNPTFLKYLLLSPPIQQRIKDQGTGATVQGIKASLLKKIRISFPSNLHTQDRLVTMLDDFTAEIDRLEYIYRQKLTALDHLKKSLLHQAFSGQL